MRVKHVIRHFEGCDSVPIKPMQVARLIMEAGIVGEIIFVEPEYDTQILRGSYLEGEVALSGPYEGPQSVRKVYVASNQDEAWRRLTCCKELLHILDPPELSISRREAVSGLIKMLTLPVVGQFEVFVGRQSYHNRVSCI